jgi:ubiquinone/menaquinone biosynthesis C-methylase UbiE
MSDLRASDPAVKAQERRMWASGDFPKVSRETVAPVGPELVQAAGVRTGDKVLDVGAGSGNTAIPAALAGGDVVASDLTPELLAAGRSAAVAAGVALEWVEADAEALPFAAGRFDVVTSSFGVMFAPHHQVAADELVRVTRPGGTIALATWTPEGWTGEFFAVMSGFRPPPPADEQPPMLWGVEDHVRGLFGDAVEDFRFEPRTLVVDHFDTPEALVSFYQQNFGPTIAAYAAVGDDAERRDALDAALLDLATRTNRAGPGERARWDFEWALITARRA